MFLLRVISPSRNIAALGTAFELVRERRGLVMAMTARELTDRYAGQLLGAAWAIVAPLLTMLIYVWVFTFVFRGRLGETDDPTAFTAYALAGLAPWVAFGEAVSRSVSVVSGNANLVKQIVFPLEVLPLKVVLASLPTLMIGLVLAVGASAAAGLLDPLRLLLALPAAVACYLVFVSGLALMLSSFSVFARDLKEVVTVILGIGLFLHPILYPPGAAPSWLRASFDWNPIAAMIRCFHYAIVGPVDGPTNAWIMLPLVAALALALGWRVFRALKPAFGNVL